jgi:ectoine hydroxylase-related dioxygenase (phytanoyl-CoA dioxygenase family)
MHYVRGSHREPLRPHIFGTTDGSPLVVKDFVPHETDVHYVLEPGDAVVHHGGTIHYTNPNRTTDRYRPAFSMFLFPVSAKRDEVLHRAKFLG